MLNSILINNVKGWGKVFSVGLGLMIRRGRERAGEGEGGRGCC